MDRFFLIIFLINLMLRFNSVLFYFTLSTSKNHSSFLFKKWLPLVPEDTIPTHPIYSSELGFIFDCSTISDQILAPLSEIQVRLFFQKFFPRYAKMWYKGVSFTSEQCTLVYLVDAAGTRSTTDTFSDLNRVIIGRIAFKPIKINKFKVPLHS